MTLAGSVLILMGCVFCFLAALGVLRFPDGLTRMHAATKAGTLGIGLVIAGAAIASADLVAVLWAAVALLALVLAAPVSAHLLARASLKGDNSGSVKLSINEYVRKD